MRPTPRQRTTRLAGRTPIAPELFLKYFAFFPNLMMSEVAKPSGRDDQTQKSYRPDPRVQPRSEDGAACYKSRRSSLCPATKRDVCRVIGNK